MILPSSVSNFGSFEEFKIFINGVLVTAIAQRLHWLKATGDR
ncbi:hypothetical protein [Nostoc sp.]